MINALNTKALRTKKGGYLFKAGSDEENLYFGIIPCTESGERTHHYDISMPEKLEYILIGSIIPDGIFSILFIPADRNLTDQMRQEYRSAYIDLAEGLIERGLTKPGELDEVSTAMVTKAEIFPESPSSLLEITAQDKSMPRKS